MLNEHTASALNCDRRNLVLAVEEMENFVKQAKAELAEPITVDSDSFPHPDLTRFLGVSMRVTEGIANYEKSLIGRL